VATGTTVQALTVRAQAGTPRLQGSILIVDDDDIIRNLFLELFRPEGVSVRVAASGQEAISLLKQSTPSLLIVDVSLPDRDGITVLEEAQKIDNRIIGVVMTGAPTVELAVRAMKAGATDFLMKPVQNDVVLMTARRLLELHHLRAENTVLKNAAVRTGAVRLHSLPLQTFGDDGSLRGQDGLTEFERGLAEGARRAEEGRRLERSLFASAVLKLDETRSSLQQAVEDDVVALAFQIASKILHESATACKGQIVTQARAALATVRESGLVVIQVHPADMPALDAARAELVSQRDIALTLKIEPVPTIPRGSCLIHTVNRLIDASLDTQLFRLGEALKTRNSRESR
jgi:FixJ family two-component response regulator